MYGNLFTTYEHGFNLVELNFVLPSVMTVTIFDSSKKNPNCSMNFRVPSVNGRCNKVTFLETTSGVFD